MSPNARRKVLAGIVMTSSADDEEAASTAKVISLGTGTKCINGEYMSDKVGRIRELICILEFSVDLVMKRDYVKLCYC